MYKHMLLIRFWYVLINCVTNLVIIKALRMLSYIQVLTFWCKFNLLHYLFTGIIRDRNGNNCLPFFVLSRCWCECLCLYYVMSHSMCYITIYVHYAKINLKSYFIHFWIYIRFQVRHMILCRIFPAKSFLHCMLAFLSINFN
jgi:hypothetical protein